MRKKISASEQILSAAIGCIARKGCTNVTMRDIADEAGVVLSQLSYYYRNKETLFSQVLRSMRRDYLLEIEAGMAACEGEEAKLRFLIRHNRHLLEHNADLYRAFLDFFNMALWSASFRTEMENFLGELAGAIRQQMALPPGTAGATGRPAILPEMILGTSFGIAMQFLINPEKNRAALAGFDLLEGLLVVPAAGRGAEG